MINPVNHARSPKAIATYKVEPYVVAADVYAVSPHTGRGGWTWYTGSAGWMYRLIVESLLGLRLEVDDIAIRSVPSAELDDVQDALPVSRNRLSHHGAPIRFREHLHDGDHRWRSASRPGDPLVDDRHEHSVAVTVPTP